MLNSLFVAATWLIGALGIGGTIAVIAGVIFLGPAAVIGFIRPIALRFLTCTPCVVLAVFILATVASYWIGHHEAVKECRADALEAQLRNERIDAQAARDAKADETRRANEIERRATKQHDEDQAYIDQLKSKPACSLDDSDIDDARRMRVHPRPRGAHAAGKTR